MVDEVDSANDAAEEHRAALERLIRRQAANMPKGSPGTCDDCDQYFTRIVLGLCARCRELKEKETR